MHTISLPNTASRPLSPPPVIPMQRIEIEDTDNVGIISVKTSESTSSSPMRKRGIKEVATQYDDVVTVSAASKNENIQHQRKLSDHSDIFTETPPLVPAKKFANIPGMHFEYKLVRQANTFS